MPPEENIHAGCVVLGDRGVLIAGRSGSGKTSLALELVSASLAAGRFARLVSDDRTLVSIRAGRLVARSPASIAGLAEVYGLGPRPIGAEAAAVVDLVVDLVAPEQAVRFNDGRIRTIAGCELPALALAEGRSRGAALAVTAWFELRPFLRGGS